MLKAIGLMSGTSLDGVDVALIETDGERIGTFGPTSYRAYTDSERDLLRKALADAVSVTERGARPGSLKDAESLVTRAHAETPARARTWSRKRATRRPSAGSSAPSSTK